MKVLNNSHLDKIHGGWAQFVGGAFAGWALGEYVFSPARDQLVGSLKKEHERLLSDF
ncbi:hypothetical protein [Rodentibacter caecimuris]|uniref:hypothetical protein n=1 Tax=Rodentibacter caecimuris TaxID=1796644 RepID=UPI0022490048|nr:hypothetical protein [Rodentibacter heylii]MCX2962302.1 hypothetical protein [Rodentibacter heylii]